MFKKFPYKITHNTVTPYKLTVITLKLYNSLSKWKT